jgi:cytidylate kinase
MIITVSGVPGAGSTTVSEQLSKRLKYKMVAIGELHKKLAEEEGISSAEFERAWRHDVKNPAQLKLFHNKLDKMQKNIARKEKDAVFNGKLSAFQIPWADLKVFLTAPLQVRAKRIAGREGISVDKALKSIKERESLERREWKRLYGFDYAKDLDVYDMVINTEQCDAKETAKIIEKMVLMKVKK